MYFSTDSGRIYIFNQKHSQKVSNAEVRQNFCHQLISTGAYFRPNMWTGKTETRSQKEAVENKFIFVRPFSTKTFSTGVIFNQKQSKIPIENNRFSVIF